jgi:CheY-like chemotaxis protein
LLVISRKAKQSVSFPQLGVIVKFLQVRSGQVRVGIEAPERVAICRDNDPAAHEMASRLCESLAGRSELPREMRHRINNELQQISVGFALYTELMRAGQTQRAAQIQEGVEQSLARLGQVAQPEPEPCCSKRYPPADSCQVLVVDDNRNERELLAGLLVKQFEVETLGDGDQVLEYFQHRPAPAVMLLDMQMPGRNGAETLRQLNDAGLLDHTSVFAVSGLAPQHYGIDPAEDGLARWFPKPLRTGELIEAVRGQLSTPRCDSESCHSTA